MRPWLRRSRIIQWDQKQVVQQKIPDDSGAEHTGPASEQRAQKNAARKADQHRDENRNGHPQEEFVLARPGGGPERHCSHSSHFLAAIVASFATVFMLRAVPDLAAAILSFELAIPLP